MRLQLHHGALLHHMKTRAKKQDTSARGRAWIGPLSRASPTNRERRRRLDHEGYMVHRPGTSRTSCMVRGTVPPTHLKYGTSFTLRHPNS
ncbi:uncharacterized protein [Panulirus ornatus]|uniref:uncharacterized protein isoform X3 n=1 Tax=Panulirus ornatus TaxID=150431 RepID=UPI003A86699F